MDGIPTRELKQVFLITFRKYFEAPIIQEALGMFPQDAFRTPLSPGGFQVAFMELSESLQELLRRSPEGFMMLS